MKKVLFIDRDGTLIIEPPLDYQVDSLEKLEFYPGVFQWLTKITNELDYDLVMVTNQDGLGTETFPEDKFWPAQNMVIKSFKNEGITFKDIYIDKTRSEDSIPTRKPGTAMLGKYIYGDYDLKNSFVIGDRHSDIELAKNLNSKAIFIGDQNKDACLCTTSWETIYHYLKKAPRSTTVVRTTNETDIRLTLNLYGKGKTSISTGLGFFDHMLEQIARHGNMDLEIHVKGDLHIDEHHTIEDVAITLGSALEKAIYSKKGIERYGFVLPMDDCIAQVAIDLGGRSWLNWNVEFKREMIGKVPTEMFSHFFKSFCDAAKCNLHITASGNNEHHKIEAIFKAFAKALKMAKSKTSNMSIPSTKGKL